MSSKLFGGGGDATATNQADIEAKIDIIDANLDVLVERAQCDAGMGASTTTITCTDLAGYTDDYFNNGWMMCILLNVNSAGNAPENQWRNITNYVSATGVFTVDAFSANVEENDYIVVARNEYAFGSMTLKHQTPAWSDDAAVQNTWYTVIDTTLRGLLHKVGMAMQTAAENLEMKLTIDGVEYNGAQAAAVAGTNYLPGAYVLDETGAPRLYFQTVLTISPLNLPFETLKVEVRKTSANGANNLNGWVIYSLWEY